MALQQKLAAFLETRDLKELKGTAVDVLFEFVRGELKTTRVWKFLAVAELIRDRYKIRPVPESVDNEKCFHGNYAEKTQYIRDSERDLAEKLMDALEFRISTYTFPMIDTENEWKENEGGRWEDERTMEPTSYNPHLQTLNYWLNYKTCCPEKGTFVDGDGYCGFQYEGYEVHTTCDFILRYKLPPPRKLQ